jgi:hypothetical protein
MSPKFHHTPLSGGDRKALKKELVKARAMTGILAEQSVEKRRLGEALIREADNLACQSWNEKMWSDGGPAQPSPTRQRSWRSPPYGRDHTAALPERVDQSSEPCPPAQSNQPSRPPSLGCRRASLTARGQLEMGIILFGTVISYCLELGGERQNRAGSDRPSSRSAGSSGSAPASCSGCLSKSRGRLDQVDTRGRWRALIHPRQMKLT